MYPPFLGVIVAVSEFNGSKRVLEILVEIPSVSNHVLVDVKVSFLIVGRKKRAGNDKVPDRVVVVVAVCDS